MNRNRLVAGIEFEGRVGVSFGNNFNNRAGEAIGTAVDFWTAYREGALGENIRYKGIFRSASTMELVSLF